MRYSEVVYNWASAQIKFMELLRRNASKADLSAEYRDYVKYVQAIRRWHSAREEEYQDIEGTTTDKIKIEEGLLICLVSPEEINDHYRLYQPTTSYEYELKTFVTLSIAENVYIRAHVASKANISFDNGIFDVSN